MAKAAKLIDALLDIAPNTKLNQSKLQPAIKALLDNKTLKMPNAVYESDDRNMEQKVEDVRDDIDFKIRIVLNWYRICASDKQSMKKICGSLTLDDVKIIEEVVKKVKVPTLQIPASWACKGDSDAKQNSNHEDLDDSFCVVSLVSGISGGKNLEEVNAKASDAKKVGKSMDCNKKHAKMKLQELPVEKKKVISFSAIRKAHFPADIKLDFSPVPRGSKKLKVDDDWMMEPSSVKKAVINKAGATIDNADNITSVKEVVTDKVNGIIDYGMVMDDEEHDILSRAIAKEPNVKAKKAKSTKKKEKKGKVTKQAKKKDAKASSDGNGCGSAKCKDAQYERAKAHSRAYHKERTAQIKNGVDKEEASRLARLAGLEASKEWSNAH